MHGYGDNLASVAVDRLDLDDQVEFIFTYLEAKKLEKVWLVGHSVGGALAMLFAAKFPKMVLGIVNIEGNFTLGDAFWSQRISKLDASSWQKEYETLCGDPAKWLSDGGIQPTDRRIQWAREVLCYQNAKTIQSVAKTVVERTGRENYLELIQKVLESEIPVFLYAGENSRKDWNVPDFVLERAAQVTIHPSTGHMMMLEDPDEFCKNLERMMGTMRKSKNRGG